MMTTLTIRLPEDLRHDLEDVCREQSRSAGDVVRDLLKRYLAIAKFRSLRAKALPFAEAQGLLTDDDVFKHLS
jgi:predicted transcriptional regulator